MQYCRTFVEDLIMYSDIIAPEVYNRLMGVHSYIPASDRSIIAATRQHCSGAPRSCVVEVGCGPGRITDKIAQNVPSACVIGVDHDAQFIAYAQRHVHKARIVHGDIMNYTPDSSVDVIVSQGFHHHVPKAIVGVLLARLHQWLAPNGIYVVGDEFLPYYSTESERRLRCVVWYAHIISHAQKRGEQLLAREEAKTLLDDLQIEQKSEQDVEGVLRACVGIEEERRRCAYVRAQELLFDIDASSDRRASGDCTLDLSRGDYKVDHAHFINEVESAGFRIASVQTFGPHLECGSMSVFVLRKQLDPLG